MIVSAIGIARNLRHARGTGDIVRRRQPRGRVLPAASLPTQCTAPSQQHRQHGDPRQVLEPVRPGDQVPLTGPVKRIVLRRTSTSRPVPVTLRAVVDGR